MLDSKYLNKPKVSTFILFSYFISQKYHKLGISNEMREC